MARTQTGRRPATPAAALADRVGAAAGAQRYSRCPGSAPLGGCFARRPEPPVREPRARVAGALAVALVLAAAAPGAQAQSGFVAIDFTTATTSGNAQAGRTAGTFTSTGRVRDAGRMTTAYRAVGTQVDATAMLIGTRGILTIGLRGALGPILGGHQSVAGRWRVCGARVPTCASPARGAGRP